MAKDASVKALWALKVEKMMSAAFAADDMKKVSMPASLLQVDHEDYSLLREAVLRYLAAPDTSKAEKASDEGVEQPGKASKTADTTADKGLAVRPGGRET